MNRKVLNFWSILRLTIFCTTRQQLDYFNIKNNKVLPKLRFFVILFTTIVACFLWFKNIKLFDELVKLMLEEKSTRQIIITTIVLIIIIMTYIRYYDIFNISADIKKQLISNAQGDNKNKNLSDTFNNVNTDINNKDNSELFNNLFNNTNNVKQVNTEQIVTPSSKFSIFSKILKRFIGFLESFCIKYSKQLEFVLLHIIGLFLIHKIDIPNIPFLSFSGMLIHLFVFSVNDRALNMFYRLSIKSIKCFIK